MGKKILIVDDDQGISNSLSIIFGEEGYCVDAATDSGNAAKLIRENKYDVCIFDYKMRGLTGKDLLKITKSLNPRSRVFIISGVLNITEIFKKEFKAGLIAGIIGKPFDAEDLLKKIAAIIPQKHLDYT